MLKNILLFFGCLKIVSVDINQSVDDLSKILKHKTVYIEKYRYPHMTRQVLKFYEIKNIRYVNTAAGPYCLDFFNRLFYYEWK